MVGITIPSRRREDSNADRSSHGCGRGARNRLWPMERFAPAEGRSALIRGNQAVAAPSAARVPLPFTTKAEKRVSALAHSRSTHHAARMMGIQPASARPSAARGAV